MKHLKYFEKRSYMGLKVGDIVVLDEGGTSVLTRGEKYIITEIGQLGDDLLSNDLIPKEIVDDPHDFIKLKTLDGERFFDTSGQEYCFYVHRFKSELEWDANKFNL